MALLYQSINLSVMNSTTLSLHKFEVLLEAVHEAIERSNQVRPDSSLDIDRRYNTAYILRISKSLSLPEISMLLSLSEMREQGLLLLRKDDLPAGMALLEAAGQPCSHVELSEEALLLLESFQTAAQAFLQFKLAAYDEAVSLLYRAIDSLETLHDLYGHEAAVRRIHLARNIVHVLSRANRGEEALCLNSELLKYLTGNNPWPIHTEAAGSLLEEISRQEKIMLGGQLLMEMDYLLIKPPLPRKEMSEVCIDLIQTISAQAELQVVACALAAQHALFEDDELLFLKHTLSFFSDKDVQYLPGVKRQLINKLSPPS